MKIFISSKEWVPSKVSDQDPLLWKELTISHLFILKNVSQQGLKVIIPSKCDDSEIRRDLLCYENTNTTFKNKIEIMKDV